MTNVIASGTVTVRSLSTGREWEEMVEVFEDDLDDTDGTTLTVEDAARRVARYQAGGHVETLEAEVS